MAIEETDVQFEEDLPKNEFHIKSRRLLGERETPSSIRFLLDKKIVKTETQATVLIISVVLVFLAISAWIIYASVVNSGDLIIIDRFGREIPFDTYLDMLKKGEDPVH